MSNLSWAILDISANFIFSKRKMFLLQHLNSDYFSVTNACITNKTVHNFFKNKTVHNLLKSVDRTALKSA